MQWNKITKITMFPSKLRRSVKKSRAMYDHRHCGVGNSISFYKGKVHGILACVQEEQKDT